MDLRNEGHRGPTEWLSSQMTRQTGSTPYVRMGPLTRSLLTSVAIPERLMANIAATRVRSNSTMRWMDISVPVRNGMVHWPGDPPIRIWHPRHMDKGDHLTLSAISMGSHTGTHMDAPGHFLRGGRTIDRMPMDATMGPARVIEIRDRRAITPEELIPQRIRRGERLLFKTANSKRGWPRRPFLKDFVALSVDAARWLAARRVRVVGVDYLSVGGYRDDGTAVHRALLRAGIWIIEGLDLAGVRPGAYELVCLPLRLHRGDGAPARAVIRPRRRVH